MNNSIQSELNVLDNAGKLFNQSSDQSDYQFQIHDESIDERFIGQGNRGLKERSQPHDKSINSQLELLDQGNSLDYSIEPVTPLNQNNQISHQMNNLSIKKDLEEGLEPLQLQQPDQPLSQRMIQHNEQILKTNHLLLRASQKLSQFSQVQNDSESSDLIPPKYKDRSKMGKARQVVEIAQKKSQQIISTSISKLRNVFEGGGQQDSDVGERQPEQRTKKLKFQFNDSDSSITSSHIPQEIAKVNKSKSIPLNKCESSIRKSNLKLSKPYSEEVNHQNNQTITPERHPSTQYVHKQILSQTQKQEFQSQQNFLKRYKNKGADQDKTKQLFQLNQLTNEDQHHDAAKPDTNVPGGATNKVTSQKSELESYGSGDNNSRKKKPIMKERKKGRFQRRQEQTNDIKFTIMNLSKFIEIKDQKKWINRKPGRQAIPTILKEVSKKQQTNMKTLIKLKNADGYSFMSFIGYDLNKPKVITTTINTQNVSDEDEKIEPQEYYDDWKSIYKKKKQFQLSYQISAYFLLNPDNLIRALWDISLLAMIVYQAMSLPFKISFEIEINQFMFALEFGVDVMFILDILINFNTMIKINARAYIAGAWFWVDLVSSIPYTWILAALHNVSVYAIEDNNVAGNSEISSAFANAPQLLKILKTAKMLKMFKLLRVMKLKRILEKFEQYIITDSMDLMVTFFIIICQIIVIAHYMSCLFYYVGLEQIRAKEYGWIRADGIVDWGLWEKYITSMYWSFTTMSAVGYGEITPETKVERAWVMVSMMLSCGTFAYTVNRISSIISRFNRVISQYRERMLYVNGFMAANGMPQDLKNKVRHYLEYKFEAKKTTKMDEQDLNSLLNETLKDQLKMNSRGRVLQQIAFLKDFGLDFMSEITMAFEQYTYVVDDFIFMEKDRADALYYINRGKVAMIHKQSHTYITDLREREHFGELGMLAERPRSLSAKARDYTESIIIRKQIFYKVAENYIEAQRAINSIKEDIATSDNYKSMNIKCYICAKNNQVRYHMAVKCPQYSKIRGNLLRMYLQMQMGQKTFSKQELEIANQKIENQEDDINDQQMKAQLFYFGEEVHEEYQRHMPSEESEENIEIKKAVIRKAVKSQLKIENNQTPIPLDGLKMFEIFEQPQNLGSVARDIMVQGAKMNSSNFDNTPKTLQPSFGYSPDLTEGRDYDFSSKVQSLQKTDKFNDFQELRTVSGKDYNNSTLLSQLISPDKYTYSVNSSSVFHQHSEPRSHHSSKQELKPGGDFSLDFYGQRQIRNHNTKRQGLKAIEEERNSQGDSQGSQDPAGKKTITHSREEDDFSPRIKICPVEYLYANQNKLQDEGEEEDEGDQEEQKENELEERDKYIDDFVFNINDSPDPANNQQQHNIIIDNRPHLKKPKKSQFNRLQIQNIGEHADSSIYRSQSQNYKRNSSFNRQISKSETEAKIKKDCQCIEVISRNGKKCGPQVDNYLLSSLAQQHGGTHGRTLVRNARTQQPSKTSKDNNKDDQDLGEAPQRRLSQQLAYKDTVTQFLAKKSEQNQIKKKSKKSESGGELWRECYKPTSKFMIKKNQVVKNIPIKQQNKRTAKKSKDKSDKSDIGYKDSSDQQTQKTSQYMERIINTNIHQDGFKQYEPKALGGRRIKKDKQNDYQIFTQSGTGIHQESVHLSLSNLNDAAEQANCDQSSTFQYLEETPNPMNRDRALKDPTFSNMCEPNIQSPAIIERQSSLDDIVSNSNIKMLDSVATLRMDEMLGLGTAEAPSKSNQDRKKLIMKQNKSIIGPKGVLEDTPMNQFYMFNYNNQFKKTPRRKRQIDLNELREINQMFSTQSDQQNA